jgi:hypothetical protein
MEINSLKPRFSVYDVKSGRKRIMLKLKCLPVTVSVTSIEGLCELVVIVSHYNKSHCYVRDCRPRLNNQQKRTFLIVIYY